jgi:hypothetical protein
MVVTLEKKKKKKNLLAESLNGVKMISYTLDFTLLAQLKM